MGRFDSECFLPAEKFLDKYHVDQKPWERGEVALSVCPECGKEFYQYFGMRVYCGIGCTRRANYRRYYARHKHDPIFMESERVRSMDRYKKRRASRECVWCGEKSDGGIYCRFHRARTDVVDGNL